MDSRNLKSLAVVIERSAIAEAARIERQPLDAVVCHGHLKDSKFFSRRRIATKFGFLELP